MLPLAVYVCAGTRELPSPGYCMPECVLGLVINVRMLRSEIENNRRRRRSATGFCANSGPGLLWLRPHAAALEAFDISGTMEGEQGIGAPGLVIVPPLPTSASFGFSVGGVKFPSPASEQRESYNIELDTIVHEDSLPGAGTAPESRQHGVVGGLDGAPTPRRPDRQLLPASLSASSLAHVSRAPEWVGPQRKLLSERVACVGPFVFHCRFVERA